MEIKKCHCGKVLSEQEKNRFWKEIDEWARKHPREASGIDDRFWDQEAFTTGIPMDCDSCAVDRLRSLMDARASATFMERAAQGTGAEAFIVGMVIVAIMVFVSLR